MKLEEKLLTQDIVYHGKIFDVECCNVQLPNGREARRDLVRNTNAVAVVALTPEGEVILVRQYRLSAKRVMLEIPAGKLEIGEDPQAGALRELEEETGYRAGAIRPLMTYRGSVGFVCEAIYIFVATDLVLGQTHPDEDEFVTVEKIPLEEAAQRCATGQWEDGKTIAGILATSWQGMQRVKGKEING